MKVALGILAIWLVDLWDRWFYSRDVDYYEGDLMMRGRWISWGWIKAWGSGKPMHRYFCFKLPVYQWLPHWDKTGDLQLCQRAFLKFGPWPGHFEHSLWRATWFEVSNG